MWVLSPRGVLGGPSVVSWSSGQGESRVNSEWVKFGGRLSLMKSLALWTWLLRREPLPVSC